MTTTTRRALLYAGGCAGLAILARTPRSALAALRDDGFFTYRVGDVRCTALYDGIWRKEHDEAFIRNASVAETRAALVAAGLAPDVVPIEFTQTLLEIAGRRVLIDPGTGGQWVPTAGRMMRSLEAAGLGPRDIDTILISHFHPDHIFGLMEEGSDAQVFPDSEILVPETEYRFWTDPGVFTRLPDAWHGLARRIQATFPRWKNVTVFAAGREVVPGVRGLATPGHTPGHTAFEVSAGGRALLVVGDVAITPALFVAHPDWRVTFDADPELAELTRRRIFDRAIGDDAVVAGYHFGFPNAGTMVRDGDGYAFEPLTG